MNLEDIELLRAPLQKLIDGGSKINSNKPEQYWYPLSMATYGVDEILAAVDSLCSFRTTMWDKTLQFEHEFAEYQGCKEAIMVNSGSSADLLIAFSLVSPASNLLTRGDVVLVPAVTWPTQIWPLIMAGLKVRLVDVDPATLNIDLADLEAKIDKNTRAISLVHLMGNPCDMDVISALAKSHNLIILEDCCEALDARFDKGRVGGFGFASSFSFFFSHHITTMEGGMICTDDQEMADVFRLLRAHGWSRHRKDKTPAQSGLDSRYTFVNWGFNVRPTELQAGFGTIQLGKLKQFQEHRAANAMVMLEAISSYPEFIHPMSSHQKAECSWFGFPIVVQKDAPFTRDELTSYLEVNGVETRPIVAGNIGRHPVADYFPELRNSLPGAEIVHDSGLYLGIHPVPSQGKVERLSELLDSFLGRFS